MRNERTGIVLVAAHPDDEVIGAGAQLSRLKRIRIIHTTDGSPRDLRDAHANQLATREEYAAVRRRELHAALKMAGISPDRATSLGITDQEASFNLPALARSVLDVLRKLRPRMVLTHAYEGGHPDHDATAFAVHAACRMLPSPPRIIEFACYHRARDGGMETGVFLDGCGVRRLTEEQRALKRRMLDCFRTQQPFLANFLDDREALRNARSYDFTRPPHPLPLFYDAFPWGVRSDQWLDLARRALAELKL